MMIAQISIAGIRVPSNSPWFLGVVAIHVLFALACVVTGFVAMLSDKRPGRHPTVGTIYYRCLAVVVGSATVLSVMRWAEDYPLFILGALSYLCAAVGRAARRRGGANWLRVHVTAMGMSYILLVTAFYVDNGKSLPLWRDLPAFALWLVPSAVGLPLILYALVRHPLIRQARRTLQTPSTPAA